MRDIEPLFYQGDLRTTLEGHLAKATRAVDALSDEDFRSKEPEVVARDILRDFAVVPLALTEGAISVEARDADIDRRFVRDMDHGFPGASPTIRGTRVTFNVPYVGEKILFSQEPSHGTSVLPRAELRSNELRFHYEVQSSEVGGTRASFDRDLALTRQYIGWSNEQVQEFQGQLAAAVQDAVNQRVARLNATAQGLAQLGLPVRNIETVTLDAILTRDSAPEPTRAAAGPAYDVALSFAGEDRKYVQKVAAILGEAGAKVFFDEFETVALWGKDLVEHLQDIYQKQARFCVLFVSKHYVAKPWPTHERRSALARALVTKEEYLLPARFDDTEVPGLNSTTGYVDLRALSPEEFAQLVLRKVGTA